MATIGSINPFPSDVQRAFKAYISSDTYYNRERISYEKLHRMRIILNNPLLKPEDRDGFNLKHRTQLNYELINDKLYRQKDTKNQIPRYLQPLHAGRNKVWPAIGQQYYGIKSEDVEFILKQCKNCTLNRPNTTKAPLVPIISGRA